MHGFIRKDLALAAIKEAADGRMAGQSIHAVDLPFLIQSVSGVEEQEVVPWYWLEEYAADGGMEYPCNFVKGAKERFYGTDKA